MTHSKPPRTRVVASQIAPARKAALTRALNQLHPGEVQREIDTLVARLERIALTKTTAPWRAINRSFNERCPPEILGEATNQRSRRI